MKKLSVCAALLLCTGAYAADDLAAAFKEGKLEGRVRAQYFLTDWDENGAGGKNGPEARGLAVGGSLIYQTAPLAGFSAGAGLYTTQNPGGITEEEDGTTAATSKDLFSRDAGEPYGEGYAVLAQAYLQYGLAKTKIKAGRMLVTNPWITPNDTKMIPIAIEGAQIVSSDLPATTIQIDYADKIKERGMSYFGNMADAGDAPDKIKAYYATHYGNGTHGDAPAVTVSGVKNKSIPNLDVQGWFMHWPDLVDQLLFEAAYSIRAGDVTLGVAGRFIRQNDRGAGDIILPEANNYDDDNRIDSYLWALRTTAAYGPAKLLLATSRTDGGGDMIAPWRGFLTQEYTRSMTQTDWTANTRSYKAQIDYDWNALIPGFSTMLSFARYDRDPGKRPYQSLTNRGYQNGDTRQWNFDLLYKLGGGWKGLELKARLMDQENETTELAASETSNREMRLEANYFF